MWTSALSFSFFLIHVRQTLEKTAGARNTTKDGSAEGFAWYGVQFEAVL